MPDRPAIRIDHLQKSYGPFTAVHDISFDVGVGEVFCLLGPNGAGKTTTTEILEGYRTRDDGRVEVLGFDPATSGRTFRERIGIVLQECGIQDDLTVAEVLDMYGRYYPRRLPTDEVIALVELDAKATDRVRHLSGGQRRRLDVGLALIGDPEVIFLDEPTTGFDPAARRHSWATFRRLAALGKTVLLTTHFMDEAEALADRIAVVVGGRIAAEGTPATLGGRHHAPARITAQVPATLHADDLPDLAARSVEVTGGRLEAVTDDEVVTLHRLTGWALEHDTTLTEVTVTRPGLEDIYLALTADLPTDSTRTELVR